MSKMHTYVSPIGHAETLQRVLDSVARRGLTLFAQFDHAGAARAAGIEMSPEVVVVFGSPRAGTPLMQADPRIGIELPLRVLVWESNGQATVGYNDPRDLASVYDVAEEADALDGMSTLLDTIAHEAVAEPDPK